MKTMFGRTVSSALLILCLALVLVGAAFQILARNFLKDQTVEDLRADADAIAELAGAYYNRSGLDGQAFALNVALAAQASGIDAVICDKAGTVLLCSDAPLGCGHQGLSLSSDYMEKILDGEYSVDVGVIRGIYTDARYVVGVPVKIRGGSVVVGAVITSVPMAKTVSLLNRLLKIYLLAAVLVMAVAAAVTMYLSHRQSDPLRDMAKAASDFGHGDLDARVKIEQGSPLEVQELALAFNNMASSLQKTQVQQQEFVANVSHELKTPMTTIGGYVDGMLDGTIPPEKYRQYMLLVSEETKRLSRLVRNMLDISRLQEAERVPEDQKQLFDICECVGQVLITFEQAIENKGLNVQADLPEHPVYTRANMDAITQVIYNLVDNAVKFSRSVLGARVQESGDKLYLSVYNDGETIPPEELPLVFDRFHKLDKSRTDNRNGWGLGLYIVKNIVCRHGEDISVSSRDGTTTFTFTLPIVN